MNNLCGCVGCRELQRLFDGLEEPYKKRFESPQQLRDWFGRFDSTVCEPIECTGKKSR